MTSSPHLYTAQAVASSTFTPWFPMEALLNKNKKMKGKHVSLDLPSCGLSAWRALLAGTGFLGEAVPRVNGCLPALPAGAGLRSAPNPTFFAKEELFLFLSTRSDSL